MATKKKPAAKKPAPKKTAPKAVKKPAPAAKSVAARPAAASHAPAKTRNAPTPRWLNNAIRYAEKNPAKAVATAIAVILGLLIIFG